MARSTPPHLASAALTSPVQWLADGSAHSPRFCDTYHSRSGALAQAQQVFLTGCALLPDAQQRSAWAGQPQWQVLETGFGLGLNFLATWLAWRADAQRPQRLFFTSAEAWPVAAADIARCAQAWPELVPLAAELAAQWRGLLPGVHRLAFDGGAVQLTLLVGDALKQLQGLDTCADSVFLDGFAPERNPDMWQPPLLQALARLCRPGTRLATWCVAGALRRELEALGFRVGKAPGLAPKRERLQAQFSAPTALASPPTASSALAGALSARPLRLRATSGAAAEAGVVQARAVGAGRHALVLGAGLAGSAAAWSLAQRGWSVAVLERGAAPAAGASGLPAGLVLPHVSSDDCALSRISRAGVRASLQRAQALLVAGRDWQISGVLEHRVEKKRARPLLEGDAARWFDDWSQEASAEQLAAAGLMPDRAALAASPASAGKAASALWHPGAAWLRPAQLVQAQLAHPNIRCRTGCAVQRLQRTQTGWAALDAQGRVLAEAAQVVLAAGFAVRALLDGLAAPEASRCVNTNGPAKPAPALPLQALYGQVSWGRLDALEPAARALLPPWPVNGFGSLLHGMCGPDGAPMWIVGSTFERGERPPSACCDGHPANQLRLQRLLPALAGPMASAFAQAQGWAALRCTLPDRLPAVGSLAALGWPGLHVLTGLGARGLSLSVLCGELLAAQLHAEPWPLEPELVQRLLAQRFAPANAPASTTPQG